LLTTYSSPPRKNDGDAKRPRLTEHRSGDQLPLFNSPNPHNPHKSLPPAYAAASPHLIPATVNVEIAPNFRPTTTQKPVQFLTWPIYKSVSENTVRSTKRRDDGSYTLYSTSGSRTHFPATEIKAGSGARSTAYCINYTPPDSTVSFHAVGIYYQTIPNHIVNRGKQFGQLETIRMDNGTYLSLSKRGVTFDDAYKTLRTLPYDNAYKLAFLLHYLSIVIDSLVTLHVADRTHQDVKPANMVILGKNQASAIDIDQAPLERAYTFDMTEFFSSPDRKDNGSSKKGDSFSLAKSIRDGFPLYQTNFSLTLWHCINKALYLDRDLRPSLEEMKDAFRQHNVGLNTVNSAVFRDQFQAVESAFFDAHPFLNENDAAEKALLSVPHPQKTEA